MTKEDDPRITRYNQRIVEASAQFMPTNETTEPDRPGIEHRQTGPESDGMMTGISGKDVDMQEASTPGNGQDEAAAVATSSGHPGGSRHAREGMNKRHGGELREELDRATKWIREDSHASKRVIDDQASPDQGKRPRQEDVKEDNCMGMICDVR